MKNRKILVVDDEPFILRSLTYVLKREGYETFTATDGEAALAVIAQEKPELIFLDVMIPKKNGFQVCQEVKNNPEFKNTRVVLLTAKGQESDRQKGKEVGADDYIAKPFSPSRIVQSVRDTLG